MGDWAQHTMWIAVDCLHPNTRCSGRAGIYWDELRGALYCAGSKCASCRELCGWGCGRVRARLWQRKRDTPGSICRTAERGQACDDASTRRNLGEMGGAGTAGMKAPALVELREMDGDKGKFVFLFNHGEKAAEVEFAQTLARPAANVREIVTAETWKTGETVHEDGSSGAGSADLPDQLLRLVGGTTRRRGRHRVGLRACPWFSWRAGKCE